MAENTAINKTIPDSPHILAATNVDRGATPAVWDAVGSPTVTGPWTGVDQDSGPVDENWNVTKPFDSGPGRWEQT